MSYVSIAGPKIAGNFCLSRYLIFVKIWLFSTICNIEYTKYILLEKISKIKSWLRVFSIVGTVDSYGLMGFIVV